MLEYFYSSDVRKHLGETLDIIEEQKIPYEIKKKIAGGSKDFVFMSKDIFLGLLEHISFNAMVLHEEDQSITLEMDQLNLAAWGEDLESALNDLVEDMFVYAEEYKSNIKLYLNAPNRKEHFLPLLKVWTAESKEQLKMTIQLIS